VGRPRVRVLVSLEMNYDAAVCEILFVMNWSVPKMELARRYRLNESVPQGLKARDILLAGGTAEGRALPKPFHEIVLRYEGF